MSAPDFERADYIQPLPPATVPPPPDFNQPFQPFQSQQMQQPFAPAYDQAGPDAGAFVKAILFGAVAAFVGSIGWGLFAQTGIMVSIIAIGIAYLVARAMMTATGGLGGRTYQIAAVILTYFGCTVGDVWAFVISDMRHGVDFMHNIAATALALSFTGSPDRFWSSEAAPSTARSAC